MVQAIAKKAGGRLLILLLVLIVAFSQLALMPNESTEVSDDQEVETESAAKHAVVVSESSGGSVEADVYEAAADQKVTLTIAPEAGYTLDSLTLTWDGSESSENVTGFVSADNTYTFTMQDADVTVNAIFVPAATLLEEEETEPAAYTITVDSPVADNLYYGDISTVKKLTFTVDGGTSDTATAGQTIVLKTPPGLNSYFSLSSLVLTYDEGDGSVDHEIDLTALTNGSNYKNYTFVMPASNVTIKTTYSSPNFSIPNSIENGTLGIEFSSGSYNKIETATETIYYIWSTVSFTIVPEPADGYVHKTGSTRYINNRVGYVQSSGVSGLNITMYAGNGNYVYTAEFVKADIGYDLKLDITGSDFGKVNVDPAKDTYSAGDVIKITLVANEGCIVSNSTMKLAGATVPTLTTVSADYIYTFTMPTNDVTASVTFGRTRTITIDPDLQNGALSISPNTLETVAGTTFTVTPTAASGYAIKGKSIGYSTDGGKTFTYLTAGKTFVMPDSDILLTAEFSNPGSITAGVVEAEYAGAATEKIFEVPVTIIAPDSPDTTIIGIYLSYLTSTLNFQYIRIGDSDTKLTANGTDSVNGWTVSGFYTYSTYTQFSLYPGAVGGGETLEAGKEYVIHIGFSLAANITASEIALTASSANNRFTLASYGVITPAKTDGKVQIKWTSEEPPHNAAGTGYYLSTPQQLMWFADAIASGKVISAYLTADIDMTGYETENGRSFEGIGTKDCPYTLSFYGQNYTVTYDRTVSGDDAVGFINYYEPTSSSAYIYINQLNVKANITVESGSPDVGLIAGYSSGLIQIASAEGSITVKGGGDVNVGGVVGRTTASVWTQSINATTSVISDVDITVESGVGGNIGGVVGFMDCSSLTAAKSIMNTYYTGTIYVAPGEKDATVGGIVGRAEGNILLYQNGNGGRWNTVLLDDSGSVTGRGVTGGIAGYLNTYGYATSIYTNVNASAISGTGSTTDGSATGGLFGIYVGSSYLGHTSTNGTVTSAGVYSYINRNYGNVSGDTQYIGGVAGYYGGTTVKYAYNEGAITSTSTKSGAAVGGVMGYFAGGEAAVLQNAINKGSVTATGTAARGGLIGIIGDTTMPALETLAEARLNYYANVAGLSGISNLSETDGIKAVPGANLSPVGYAEGFPGEGSGTADDPYLIGTYDQLMWFSEGVNSSASLPERQRVHVKLIADIDLSDYPSFVSIGTYNRPFYGTFDGDGHTITLAIYRDTVASMNYASLFGYCTNATIKNLTIAGTVYASTDAAGLVYWFQGSGTLENIINKADVTAGMDASGIAKYANGTMTNCVNYGTITSTEALVYANQESDTSRYSVYTGKASGLFGGASGTITGCENHGTVEAKYRAAGIAGTLSTAYGQTTMTIVSNCINTGSITSYGDVASDYGSWLSGTHMQEYNSSGGIIACVYNEGIYLITGCENSGTISGSGNNVGGILATVGIPDSATAVFEVSVTNCKNSGTIISTYEGSVNFDKVNVGGIVGNAVGSTGSGAAQTTGFIVSGNENTGTIIADERANVSSIVGRDTWTNNPGSVNYENSDNTTNEYYGNDEYKAGVSVAEVSDPITTDPTPPTTTGNSEGGNGTDGDGTDGDGTDGDSSGSESSSKGSSDNNLVKATDKTQATNKAAGDSSEGIKATASSAGDSDTAIPVNTREVPNLNSRLDAAPIDFTTLESIKEDSLLVDETSDSDTEETQPDTEPQNKNISLDVAMEEIERSVESSTFMYVAWGLAGVAVLGVGGYALAEVLKRRRNV